MHLNYFPRRLLEVSYVALVTYSLRLISNRVTYNDLH